MESSATNERSFIRVLKKNPQDPDKHFTAQASQPTSATLTLSTTLTVSITLTLSTMVDDELATSAATVIHPEVFPPFPLQEKQRETKLKDTWMTPKVIQRTLKGIWKREKICRTSSGKLTFSDSTCGSLVVTSCMCNHALRMTSHKKFQIKKPTRSDSTNSIQTKLMN